MKARLGTVVFLSILSAAFGFAVFLLVAADETPAPGLILMGVCGIALARYLTRARPRAPEAADPHDIFRLRTNVIGRFLNRSWNVVAEMSPTSGSGTGER